MKLILLLSTLFCFTAKAQTSTCHASRVTQSKWNSEKNKWEYDEPIDIDLTFTMQGRVILVNDKANSTYTTIRQTINDSTSEPKQSAWKAIDEKNRNCLFKMYWYKNSDWYIVVMYDDYAWSYYMGPNNPDKLDKFHP